MSSSNKKFIDYRKTWKYSRNISRLRRQIPSKIESPQKKDYSFFFNCAQIILAVMSIVTPLVYRFQLSGKVEIDNMEKVDEYNKARDLSSQPAEVVGIGRKDYFSRYFTNNEDKNQVEATVINDKNTGGDEHNIGMPVSYCDGKLSPPTSKCDDESGALSYYSFSLKGKTKNPAVVTRISAIIDSSEDFYPEILYFTTPQGSGENTLFGFDFGSDDLEARDVAEYGGMPNDVHHLVKNHINLTEKDVVPVTASFLVPPGKRINFHLEIYFEGHSDPLIIKDGDKPLTVVSYPKADSQPKRTYVPINVIDDDYSSEISHITQCQWYAQCKQMVHGNIWKEDISND